MQTPNNELQTTLALKRFSHADPTDTIARTVGEAGRRIENKRLTSHMSDVLLWLGQDIGKLEEAITDQGLECHAPARYLLEQRGKRIRPLCVMLAARLGGKRYDNEIQNLAVAAELVHAATLLHDDVIDDGTERRGKPAARVIYGNSASLLAGDHLLVRALDLVRQVDHPLVLQRLLEVISQMVTAEIAQLERRGRLDADENSYLSIIEGKTAVFFGWCLEAGGRMSSLDEESINALLRVGHALGIAFQLVDDVIDLTAEQTASGKDTLSDLREGKMTWPILHAMRTHPAVTEGLSRLLEQDVVEKEQLETIMQHIVDTGAIDATRAFALSKTEEAIAEVKCLPTGKARSAIEAVVETIVQRMA